MLIRWFTVVYLLIGAFSVQAQDQAAEAQAADYGPAFDRLIKLGLTDTNGATYVALKLQTGDGQRDQSYYGGYGRGTPPKRDGNAWLMPGEKDGASTLIHNYYQRISVMRKKKRGGLMRALVGKAKTPDGVGAVGDWKSVKVSKDAEKILTGLDAMAKAGQVFNADQWEYDNSAAEMASKVLVMACHMYRAGHTKEGNQIAQKILSLSPNPERLIDGIVNELANKQYQLLVEAFFKTKDWKVYHEGLTALTKKYSRGWSTRLGAQILLPKIDQKIKGTKAELKQFKGITLKPEAVKILDDLLTQTEPILVTPTPYWLIVDANKKPSGGDYRYRQNASAPEWIKKICAMGMDGFVALAAAAGDESLIATSIQSASHYYSRSYMMGSRSSLDQQALMAYRTMQRPCTRGEIVRKILISTMPDNNNELGQKPPDELRDIAYQWWLAHRGDSKSALARHIMEVGNNSARQIAVNTLIESGKDEDAKLVEQYILSADSLSSSVQMVEPYLKARRGKAREFFQNYSTILTDMAANGEESSLPWNLRKEGDLPKFLKRLSVYVEDVSAEKIITDMRSGKTPVKEGVAMLGAAMGNGEIVAQLPALVTLASEKDKLIERVEILQGLVSLISSDDGGGSEEEDEAYMKQLIASMLKSKADWQKLLSHTQTTEDQDEQKALNNLPSIAVYAAWTMEMTYLPHHTGRLQQINLVLGREKMNAFMMNRAKALLENPETAEFPDAEKVDEERSAGIRDELRKLTSVEIMAYYEKLTLSEKLAWMEVLSGYENELPEGVAGLSKLIVRLNWDSALKADASYQKDINDIFLNKEMNQELVDQFISFLAKDAERHAQHMFLIQSTGQPGSGMSLRIWSGAQAQSWKDGMITTGAELLNGGKVTSMAGVSSYIDGNWLTGAKYLPAKEAPDESDNIKKVIESVQTNITVGTRFNIVFFSETAANIKKRENEEDQ